ncbi:MAG: non-homologous end-joining DNA ligase [Pseudomonadota bacterium]|uniref:non-homologous end-joining DNA ligase n=1 Tax=Roseovarius TaxID=74030 RepID=UPI0022A885FC|nr:non-homologous end-joining DNA ligase [Roseovarius sp. EGI FJ00037]MCZ0813478.1 non-homologous end-joining DNA ligase [Roseovarius sp. EGI FJ00037]
MSAKAEAETDSESDDERKIGGVRVSSVGRVVYPEVGLTKGEVAEHYARVGERMLTHAADHPLSLLRCPDGMSGDCFFQKHAGKGFPGAVKTMPVKEKDGNVEDYMYVSTREGLIGAAQMGALEFHIWGAARDRIERPDRLVFDLDPDERLDFNRVKAAAGQVRDGLEACGLQSAAMVTGGKGIHVVVPLRRISGWDRVKDFARTFAQTLAARDPDAFTATMSKSKRKGRVFIDWLRNERGATAIAPYSLRARRGAAVAVPVSWEELADLARPDGFHAGDMEARLSLPCPLRGPKARGIGKGVIEALEDWSKS